MTSSRKSPDLKIDIVIGANLRRIRRAKNLSQEELAQEIGVSFQQIQKYEQGKSRICCSTAYTLSKLLKVSLTQFFKDIPDNHRLNKKPERTVKTKIRSLRRSSGSQEALHLARKKKAVNQG